MLAALTDAEIAAICAKRHLDVTCHTRYNGTAIAIDGDLPESNMQTTFTVLVTLEHDEGQGHSPSRISEIIQCALEEGTSCSGGFESARVDAFKGRAIADTLIGTRSEMERLHRILPLHRRVVA